ncbi:MAG: signal peptidase I [Candidatus Woesearchaeota archaeon]
MRKSAYLAVASFIVGFLVAAMLYSGEVRHAFSLDSARLEGPSDHIETSDLKVFKDKAVIEKENLQWARILDTHSMEPVLNSNSISLELLPHLPSDIELGDIISYKAGSIVIIHRVVEIGNDGQWYAITKGDNNKEIDPDKVRFEQIKGVVVGVLY